jgi:predicted ATPase
MRVSKIQIKNFKNLKNVVLSDLGNIVVLIGKNSSGKSNLLDALYLFFNQFNLIEPSPLGSPFAGVDNYLWHNLETKNPIEIIIEFEFDANECDEIFPKDALGIIKNRFPESYCRVTFCRELVDAKAGWRTEYLKWADIVIVRNNKLVTPNDFCQSFAAMTTEAKATSSIPESEGAKMIGKITYSLQDRIKGKFKLARVSRDSAERSSQVVEHDPIVAVDLRETLRLLGQSSNHGDMRSWADIEEMFETSSSIRLEVRGNEIFARRNNLYLPLHLIGGGDQEILILKNFLMHPEKAIVAIEEPEMHLHPQLIKRVLKLAKESTYNSQIFLATHSPTILEKVYARCVWVAKTEGTETRFIGLHDVEDLENVLAELNMSFNDLLFAERILLVNGLLEKVMLPILASNLGVDADTFFIVPVTLRHEEPDGRLFIFRWKPPKQYHLKAWNEFSRKTNTPLFLLMYKGARNEVETLISEGSLKARNCAILPESLGNYMPLETLINVLNENYDLHLGINDIDVRKPRIHEIRRILATCGKLRSGWMTLVAEKVALKMSKEEIPNEIKMLFEDMMHAGASKPITV